MSTFIVAVILLLIVTSVIWRYASRRYTLPCPRWLGFFLDNPVAGTEASRQISKAELKPGMTVLDAGCGTGRLTLPIARIIGSQGNILAVDIQQQMLDTVSSRLRTDGLNNVSFKQLALGEGQLHENSRFDRAFLTTVLGEIPNQVETLREIYTALKPGGILSVAEIMLDPHYQSPSRIRRLAQQAGFEVESQFGSRFNFIMHLVKPE